MELEARLIGVTAQAADLVPTVRGTVTPMLSAPKTMSVETITASTTGTRQTHKLTAAFRVPYHYDKTMILFSETGFWFCWLYFETSEVRLVGGSGPHEGNILVGGLPVCDDLHDAQNAQVVCRFAKKRGKKKLEMYFPFPRMLGYSYGHPTMYSQFGSVSSTFGMDNVQCTGNEASLLDCPHLTVDNCGSTEGAGVICSNSGRLQSFWTNVEGVF